MGETMPGLRFPYRLLSGLLLSTAFAPTAFAASVMSDPEVVIVTAEKKAEDVQQVPAAVSAFSSGDMKSRQISSFRDFNFAVPNVSYTNTNFGGANFQIRGVGAIATGSESGIAVHQNDVYLFDPLMAEQSFFDIEQVEILRGPQSTLYGRGATGGVVNIISAKPNVDVFSGDGELTYGNYNQAELKAMVNIPVIDDELAVRFAGDWSKHDGFVTNLADGAKIDSRDAFAVRGSLRWEPLDGTIIDLSGSMSREDDSRMRGQKQLCTRDPSGILGCLPDSAGHDALNLNAQLTNTAASVQAIRYTAAQYGLGGLADLFGKYVGLFDLTQPAADAPPNANPAGMRQVNTDFDPTNRSGGHFASLNIRQSVTPWLDATFVGGYEDHRDVSQESFNNVAPTAFDPDRLGTFDASKFSLAGPTNGALNTLAFALSSGFLPGTGPAYAAKYAPYFSHVGKLPESRIVTNRMGLISNDILTFSPNETGYDQADITLKQYSAELRFASNLSGPVNFLVGGFYLNGKANDNYLVAANGIDFPAIALGSFLGAQGNPDLCLPTGCVRGPTIAGLTIQNGVLESKAFFGEVYYDILPSELKFTLGGRFTDDHKSALVRAVVVPGLVPIGSTDENAALADMVARGEYDFDPRTPDKNDLYQSLDKAFDSWTGRAVLTWTPKLDFTDQTTVYGSYSRGYKAGGFNVILQENLVGVTSVYKPEGIDALEIGTKNTLLDNELQANLTAWYYNYENLQVSSIIDNAPVVSNVAARLWGLEGEFLYSPNNGNWVFNLSFGHTYSALGNTLQVDTRNPSGGRSDVVLVKDATAGSTTGSNCVVYRTGGVFETPADAHLNGFFAPPGGTAALADHGVPLVNYGVCKFDLTTDQGRSELAALKAAGFSLNDPRLSAAINSSGGAAQNLHGNQLPNTPPWSVIMGAQYTWKMDTGYALVPRVDVYWQDSSWARIFEDNPDRLKQWVEINALITLHAPNDRWYAEAFVKNAAGSNAVTGQYLASSIAGLYTNTFLIDPRTYGIRVGARF
jgi:outer membrane receptor protein involved in Fe transport